MDKTQEIYTKVATSITDWVGAVHSALHSIEHMNDFLAKPEFTELRDTLSVMLETQSNSVYEEMAAKFPTLAHAYYRDYGAAYSVKLGEDFSEKVFSLSHSGIQGVLAFVRKDLPDNAKQLIGGNRAIDHDRKIIQGIFGFGDRGDIIMLLVVHMCNMRKEAEARAPEDQNFKNIIKFQESVANGASSSMFLGLTYKKATSNTPDSFILDMNTRIYKLCSDFVDHLYGIAKSEPAAFTEGSHTALTSLVAMPLSLYTAALLTSTLVTVNPDYYSFAPVSETATHHERLINLLMYVSHHAAFKQQK